MNTLRKGAYSGTEPWHQLRAHALINALTLEEELIEAPIVAPQEVSGAQAMSYLKSEDEKRLLRLGDRLSEPSDLPNPDSWVHWASRGDTEAWWGVLKRRGANLLNPPQRSYLCPEEFLPAFKQDSYFIPEWAGEAGFDPVTFLLRYGGPEALKALWERPDAAPWVMLRNPREPDFICPWLPAHEQSAWAMRSLLANYANYQPMRSHQFWNWITFAVRGGFTVGAIVNPNDSFRPNLLLRMDLSKSKFEAMERVFLAVKHVATDLLTPWLKHSGEDPPEWAASTFYVVGTRVLVPFRRTLTRTHVFELCSKQIPSFTSGPYPHIALRLHRVVDSDALGTGLSQSAKLCVLSEGILSLSNRQVVEQIWNERIA